MNQEFDSIVWWNSLRHSGLLLDRKRLAELYPAASTAISWEIVDELRRTLELGHSQTKGSSLELIDFVLSVVCGFREGWKKGPQVEASWSRRAREPHPVSKRFEASVVIQPPSLLGFHTTKHVPLRFQGVLFAIDAKQGV